jgi:hypothetical protein
MHWASILCAMLLRFFIVVIASKQDKKAKYGYNYFIFHFVFFIRSLPRGTRGLTCKILLLACEIDERLNFTFTFFNFFYPFVTSRNERSYMQNFITCLCDVSFLDMTSVLILPSLFLIFSIRSSPRGTKGLTCKVLLLTCMMSRSST